jgi:hypothetical protein
MKKSKKKKTSILIYKCEEIKKNIVKALKDIT